MTKRPGFFLTIEGVEGAGKSTLAALLKDQLEYSGSEVIVTAEPGGDNVCKAIRELLLDTTDCISDRSELMLFEAARAQHTDMLILPALNRGAIVICDRYADSSIAYQGYARGLDIDMVRNLNNYATGGLTPDLTILLDIPAAQGLARQKKIDRVSSENLAFHEAVRQGFLAVAQAEPERVKVIDATLGIDEVLKQAMGHLSQKQL